MAALHESKAQGRDSIVEPDISTIENASSENKPDTAYVLQPTGRLPPKTGLERKLVMKQDFLIIPLLALTYFVTYLVGIRQVLSTSLRTCHTDNWLQDRNGFGNGRLLGMQQELKLTDDQYGNCSQLFCEATWSPLPVLNPRPDRYL